MISRRLVAALMLVGALAACGDEPQQISAADLVHIHRLQSAPDDGLYVATHTGLYRVDNGGSIAAVGNATHDLMGFTVAGPDDLLASGHPDLRDTSLQVDGKPPLLGLVESSDGSAWDPASLLGEVDFHSLVAAHGKVYGIDSQTGALMVSDDRRTWETRASELPFTDIAVSPDDAQTLVGASPAGVQASNDGGQSWAPIAGQRLTYLAWAASDLFGVSPEGTVMVSGDGGQRWEARATVNGMPHALLVTEGGVFVANENGIFRSDDDGETFMPLLETSPS